MSETRVREEYEFKHFEFSAKEFALCTEDLIKLSIAKAVQGFEEQYKTKTGLDISEQMRKFQTNCEPHVSKCMSKITELTNEHFTIPCNVLLPGDEIQSNQFTEEEEMELDTDIERLETQIKNECYMEYRLRQELQKNKSHLIDETIKQITTDLQSLDEYLKNNTLRESEEILKVILGTVDCVNGKTIIIPERDYIFDN